MTRVSRPLVVLVVAAGFVALGMRAAGPTVVTAQNEPQAPIQPPTFRTGVDVVSINVTVSDRDGRFVTDLSPEEFLVYEDGVQQDITFFSRSQLPIALAMLMDTSASMDERMTTAQEAAIGFAQRLRPQDIAEIIDFDNRVNILQTFTNDVDALETAIRQTSAGGSTQLYNALYISLRELKKAPLRAEDLRREAIVVLSDGEDTSSLVSFEEVLDLAKRSETGIYTIGLKPSEDGRAGGFNESDYVLRTLAHETGGRSFSPDSVEDLPEIYEEISDELSSQYSLGYISGNPMRNGRWRRVVIRVARDDLFTRTKQGYFAATGN